MNIKRMAEDYRKGSITTGRNIKRYFSEGIGVGAKSPSISLLQQNVGNWIKRLEAAGVDNLELLESSWQIVRQTNEDICRGKKKCLDRIVTEEHVSQIKKAEKEFDKFLKALPELLEQALTRAVRESGIRL